MISSPGSHFFALRNRSNAERTVRQAIVLRSTDQRFSIRAVTLSRRGGDRQALRAKPQSLQVKVKPFARPDHACWVRCFR